MQGDFDDCLRHLQTFTPPNVEDILNNALRMRFIDRQEDQSRRPKIPMKEPHDKKSSPFRPA